MVVYLEFETDDDVEPNLRHPRDVRLSGCSDTQTSNHEQLSNTVVDHASPGVAETIINIDHIDENANLLTSALACYPISLALATCLDLNDLSALSSTCKSVHFALIQFAHQLRAHSLRCVNEVEVQIPIASIENESVSDAFRNAVVQELGQDHAGPAFPTSFQTSGSHFRIISQCPTELRGKVGHCARDMVAPCRRCGTSVCRNCVIKAPSNRCLNERFRRLCQTCLDAPLSDHVLVPDNELEHYDSPPNSSASSARSTRSFSSSSSTSSVIHPLQDEGKTFTRQAFLREPCTCESNGVYLCQPCGQNLYSADTTYKRVWTWRSRYSTHIGGGLGTGLGLGNQGQKCGRGQYCLEKGAGGVCWVEIECSDASAQNRRDDIFGPSRSGTPVATESDHDHVVNKPGYLSQEIEGIGGVVKKKVKKRIKVGATVYEYDDERESGKYLKRESSGQQRGWCGWCFRVCPGTKDTEEKVKLLAQ